MKKILLIFCLLSAYSFSQNNLFEKSNEIYFCFKVENKSDLKFLTKIISIDNYKNDTVFAYANKKEFSKFLEYKINYKVLDHPGNALGILMKSNVKALNSWDSYPTYDQYIAMMYKYAADYPDLCRIVEIGQTVQGRKLLFAVLSKNVNIREAEPQIMFTSSMHGDEVVGYVLMLRMIDSVLTTYGKDQNITKLLDNAELWINPLANPDGTYYTSNNSVTGSTRYNSNGVDINRNFPDPAEGAHADGNEYQPETISFMNLADSNNFSLSVNFHGGSEVINYPYDSFEKLHPDNNWFVNISRAYADTVHKYCTPGYMTDLMNGITDGYQWYPVFGGRQDYMTYFKHSREVTIELSYTKVLSSAYLPSYWYFNCRSMLNYAYNIFTGIKGVVKDNSGSLLKAKITLLNHDGDSSFVYTNNSTGFYLRMIDPGIYTVQVDADNYISQTFNNVVVTNNNQTELNIVLLPVKNTPVELTTFFASTKGTDVYIKWVTSTETNNKGFEIYKKINESEWKSIAFIEGKGNTSEITKYEYIDKNASGVCKYKLKQIDAKGNYKYSYIVEVENIINEFMLGQNYPNPFNPSSKIDFNIPVESDVVIKLYNIKGELIKNLFEGNNVQGTKSINFVPGNLSSGVYLYIIEAKKGNKILYSSGKKLVYIK